MPDGHVIPLGSYLARAMSARALGEQEARAEQDHHDWLRFREHLDGMREAIGSIESRHGGALYADGPLQDITADVAGTVGIQNPTALAAKIFTREG